METCPNGAWQKERLPTWNWEVSPAPLETRNQTVQESCQEPLPGPVNWVSNERLAKWGKSICKVEGRLCEYWFPFEGWGMRWFRYPNMNVGEARKNEKERKGKKRKNRTRNNKESLGPRQTQTKRNTKTFLSFSLELFLERKKGWQEK